MQTAGAPRPRTLLLWIALAALAGCGAVEDAAEATGPLAPFPTSTAFASARPAPAPWGAYDRYGDPALEAYVQGVAERVAATAALGDAPLRIIIVDAPAPNATAGPNNEITITLGLIALLTDESELAWVLAHEIAHLEIGHPALLADMTRAPDRDGYGRRAALRRRFETEADARGVALMRAAGYDLAGARRVTLLLGAGTEGSDLSAHPGAQERVAALTSDAPGARRRDAFLDAIAGVRFAFPGRLTALLREGVYVAPSLDLELSPPPGYALNDAGGSVEFVSPDGEIRLRLAPEAPKPISLREVLIDDLHQRIATTAEIGPLFDIRPFSALSGALSARASTAFSGADTEARLAVIEGGRRRFTLTATYPTARRDEADGAFRTLSASLETIKPDDAVLLDRFVVGVVEIQPGEDFTALRQRIDGPDLRPAFFYFFNGLDPSAPLPAGVRLKVVAYRR